MRLAFAVLCALTVIVYWPAMHAAFIYDDLHVLIQPEVTLQAPIPIHDQRALTLLTFRLNYLFSKNQPLFYHLTNLGIHLFNGWLVWQILQTLFPLEWATFAAGLFLLHPLQSEAVIYVIARAELLAACGMFASLLAVIRNRWWLALPIGLLAMTAKPNALAIPVLWGLWLIYRNTLSRKTVIWTGLAALLTLQLPHVRWAIGAILYNAHGFPTQCYAVLALLSRAVFPFGFTIEHDFVSNLSIGMKYVSIAIVTIWVVGGLIYRRSLYGFSLLWIAALILPHTVGEPEGYLSEHHLYAPFFGVAVLLTLILRAVGERYTAARNRMTQTHAVYYGPLH